MITTIFPHPRSSSPHRRGRCAGLACAVMLLLIASPATAQIHGTELTRAGSDLVKISKAEAATCQLVYEWNRCHRNPGLIGEVQGHSYGQCIKSSRNVAAGKGATHYVTKGSLFQGFACPDGTASEQAAARASAAHSQGDKAAALAEMERLRYAALGFVPWGGACTELELLYPSFCAARHDTAFARGECVATQEQVMRRGDHTYFVASLSREVTYDARRREFKVELLGVLARSGRAEDHRYISTRSLRPSDSQSALDALASISTPFTSFTVKASELPSPETIEKELVVEALVVPKEVQRPEEYNPTDVQSLEVKIAGLRAFIPDLSWGQVVQKPPSNFVEYRCPPVEL